MATAHKPLQSSSDSQTLATFNALMWAFSYPGRSQLLPVFSQHNNNLETLRLIAESLIDLETSYYTPHIEFDLQLAQTGARRQPITLALYQFYPSLELEDLESLQYAPVGTLRDPDQSATLVIACSLGSGAHLRLHGPGIRVPIDVQVNNLPEPFWALRQQNIRYPLGWDILLVDQHQIIGLPRTTIIEQRGNG